MRIEKKHLVTGALLAFVAVTGVTLAVKETAHARAVAEAESPRPGMAAIAATAAPAPEAAVPESAPPATGPLPAPEPVVAVAQTAPLSAPPAAAPARSTVPAEPIAARPEPPKPAAPPVAAPAPGEPPTTIFVTYFHTTARCTSCIRIENLATRNDEEASDCRPRPEGGRADRRPAA